MLTDLARTRTRALLERAAALFAALGVTPNALTIAGFFGIFLIGLLIVSGYEAVGGILIIFAGAFDAIDGTLARMTGRVTKFGSFLDSTLDRWADAWLYMAIVLRSVLIHDDLTICLAVLALIGSMMVSYARARGEGLGVSIKGGWFTRLERVVVLVAGLVLTAWIGRGALTIALAIIGVFANVTALQRVLAVRHALK